MVIYPMTLLEICLLDPSRAKDMTTQDPDPHQGMLGQNIRFHYRQQLQQLPPLSSPSLYRRLGWLHSETRYQRPLWALQLTKHQTHHQRRQVAATQEMSK